MENELKKKYGLLTAITLVIGIVIGSGIFFKTEAILLVTGGNVPIGLFAFFISGLVMIICANTFAKLSSKYQKVNGVVDYAEVTCGKGYAYAMGWFMAAIYDPCMTCVLAWVSARYFSVLCGFENSVAGPETMAIAGFFLIGSYCINAYAPKVAGKMSVTTTIAKLIPLILMAVAGTVIGIVNGNTEVAMKTISVAPEGQTTLSSLFKAICTLVFAFEGWIIATSINSELKNPKRDLPLALTFGSLVVVVVYAIYYLGVTSSASVEELINGTSVVAFNNVFGPVAGKIINGFIVISCLGTLNGMMMGSVRSFYALAARGLGPRPESLSEISDSTNMPYNSSLFGLFMAALWLVYFYGANLTSGWFGPFCFDSSELPIITVYAMYIPMFIRMMIIEKNMGFFGRFFLPAGSVIGCFIIIYAAIESHGIKCLYYLIMYAVIMLLGVIYYTPFRNAFIRRFLTDKSGNRKNIPKNALMIAFGALAVLVIILCLIFAK